MAVSIFELFGSVDVDLKKFDAKMRHVQSELVKYQQLFNNSSVVSPNLNTSQLKAGLAAQQRQVTAHFLKLTQLTAQSNAVQAALHTQGKNKLQQIHAQANTKLVQIAAQGNTKLVQIQTQHSSKVQQLAVQNANKLQQIAAQNQAKLQQIAARSSKAAQLSLEGLKTVGSGLQSIGNGLRNIGQSLTVAVTAPLLALGTLAVKAAFNVDALRNRFTALEGSTEKANKRIERLIQLSNQSVGVKLSDALENYAQLDAATDLSEKSIEGMIKTLGKLDTAFNLDSQSLFARNLTQIFTQGFERADIKEAIGRVPIFEQILEKAFGTSDGKKLNELKKKGKLTLESFMDGISNAVDSDSRLSGLRETLGGRFSKAFDRFQIALAPIGNAILDFIEPLIEPFSNFIQKLMSGFNSLSPFVQKLIVGFGAFVAAIAPALFIIGGIVTAIGGLIGGVATAAVAVGGFVVLAKITAIALAAIIPIAIQIGVMFASLALGVFTLYQAWQTNFGGIRDFTFAAWEAIKTVTSTVISELKSIVENSGIVTWWSENYPLILQTIQTVSTAIRNYIQFWLSAIQGFWQRHGEQILSIVRPYWEALKTLISNTLRTIGDVIKLIMQVINGDWRGAWNTFLDIVKTGVSSIATIINARLQIAWNFIKAFVSNVWETLKSGSTSWIETVTNAMTWIVGIIKGLPARIVALVPIFIQAGMDLGTAIWEGIKQGLYGRANFAISAEVDGVPLLDFSQINTSKNFFKPETPGGLDMFKKKEKDKDGGGGKKRKGGDSGERSDAKSIADALIAEAQLNLKVAERVYKAGTDLIKREFEARKINVDALTKGLIAKEEELATVRLQQIADETSALEDRLAKLGRLKSTPAVRSEERKIGSQIAALAEEEAQIEADKNEKIRQLNSDHTNIVLSDMKAQMSKELSILREGMSLAEALISRGLANRTISEEQAAKQRIALRDAELSKEREWLVAQLELNENNRDEYIRLTNEIEALDKRRVVNAENATNEINEARKKDVDNLRSYKTEMQNLMDGITSQTFDLMQQRIEILRQSGVSEKILRREQFALDRQVEIARHQQALAEIERLKDEAAQKKLTQDELLEYTRYINDLLSAEEQRHSQNLQQIALNGQVAWSNFFDTFKREIQALKDSLPTFKQAIGENILHGIESVGDIFARAFQSGKDFVDTLKQGFIDLAKEIGAAIIKLLIMKAILAAIGGGGGNNQNGGGGFLGGLRNILTGGNSSGGGGFGGIIKNFLGVGSTVAASAGTAAAGSAASAVTGGAAALSSSLAAGGAAGAAGWTAAGGSAAGGGGLFASLGAFFTNPFTLIALPAIVGGLLLWKHFKNRTEKKLRDAIQSTYSVKIKDMSVLKQIKGIGEQAFGKGQVSKRLQETIKLEPAKDLIRNYAESTGQLTDKLGASRAQLQDENFAGNRFVARMFGGRVNAGHPYIVGERRPELFVPDQSGYVYPSVPNGGSMSDKAVMALMEVISQLEAKLAAMSPGDIVGIGAKQNPDAFYSAILDAADKNTNFNNAFRRKTGESY